MAKEKRILSYFIGWLLVGFIIMFVGVNKIFASTYYMNYNYQQQYYDNYGSSVSEVGTTWMDSFNSFVSDNITTVAGSYGAGLSITSPIPLLSGHTYSMSVYFEEINNIALSSKNEISVASSLSAAANDYANNIPGTEMLYSKVSNNTVLQFVFKVDNNHTHLFFPWTTTYNTTQDYVLTQIIMEDLGASGVTENEINQSLNNQTSELNNSIQNSTNTITDKIDDMEQSIVDSNKETQEVIKDQFNSCRDSNNLFNKNNILSVNDTIATPTDTGFNVKGSWYVTYNANDLNGTYTINYKFVKNSGPNSFYRGKVRLLYTDNTYSDYYDVPYTFNANNNINKILFYVDSGTDLLDANFNDVTLNKGTSYKPYEPYGEEICTNKLDEQIETSKGIWATIKDLPNAFMNMLKGLFIPEDGYFEDWFNTLKVFFEEKLGFLATPFTIIIDFINRYLDLNPTDDIIINIPDISVPNFEDYTIIKATTFNWSDLLKSKDSLNSLWQLYLSFIDVFLILNFINLCENKYNRIFGGDTSQYEYYTVEESYTINDNTGEATNHRLNERKTTRKKVN